MKEENNQFNFATIFKGFLTAFNINRGLIPTIRDLLINPSIVIKYYIEGKIDKYGYNKYFSPGRFFVTVIAILSVFTFFAADTDISDSMIRELSLRGETDGYGGDELYVSITEKAISIMMFFVNNPMFGFLLLIVPSIVASTFLNLKSTVNLSIVTIIILVVLKICYWNSKFFTYK